MVKHFAFRWTYIAIIFYCNINIATLIQLNWNENIFSVVFLLNFFFSVLFVVGIIFRNCSVFLRCDSVALKLLSANFEDGLRWCLLRDWGVSWRSRPETGTDALQKRRLWIKAELSSSYGRRASAALWPLSFSFFFHRLHLELFHSWIKAFLPGSEKKHLNQACNNLCLLFMSLSNPSSGKKRPGCVSLPWGKAEWWIWSYCSLSFIDLLVPMDFYHWCFHFKRTLRALDCLRRIHRQLLNPHRVITTH